MSLWSSETIWLCKFMVAIYGGHNIPTVRASVPTAFIVMPVLFLCCFAPSALSHLGRKATDSCLSSLGFTEYKSTLAEKGKEYPSDSHPVTSLRPRTFSLYRWNPRVSWRKWAFWGSLIPLPRTVRRFRR